MIRDDYDDHVDRLIEIEQERAVEMQIDALQASEARGFPPDFDQEPPPVTIEVETA